MAPYVKISVGIFVLKPKSNAEILNISLKERVAISSSDNTFFGFFAKKYQSAPILNSASIKMAKYGLDAYKPRPISIESAPNI